MAEEATVTVKESTWRRMRNDAAKNAGEYREAHREGAGMVRRGDIGGGLLKIGGANAPLIVSAYSSLCLSAGLASERERK